jgi:pSer/pThr/pTyr-binding forkhead associated (FHA) protein
VEGAASPGVTPAETGQDATAVAPIAGVRGAQPAASGNSAAPISTPGAGAGVTLELGGPSATSVFTMTTDAVQVGRRDPDAGIFPEIDFEGNDIVVDGGERVHAVSRRHGRIFRDADGLKYEDLGSTNGSTLNGAAVLAHDLQPLKDGDKIVLGRTCRLLVHIV